MVRHQAVMTPRAIRWQARPTTWIQTPARFGALILGVALTQASRLLLQIQRRLVGRQHDLHQAEPFDCHLVEL